MNKAHLGILVHYSSNVKHPPFMEHAYFKQLAIQGLKQGIEITVFSPLHVNWSSRRITGYRYDVTRKSWKKDNYPIPHVLYDRIAYSSRRQIQTYHPKIKRLLKEFNTSILGRGLPGKWAVYNMLKDRKELQPFLPETISYQSNIDLDALLNKNASIFFKPASGSHGRGVFRVWTEHQRIHLKGRNKANKLFHRSFSDITAAQRWINTFIGSRVYVIQPYLELSSANKHPFDIRVLLQKNKKGKWMETGRAARVGKKDSLTSNLDGGGHAMDPNTLLQKFYTPQQIDQINENIQTIESHLPVILEERHGQLFELGIDIGVDHVGHVWILEVNSKPGRESFKLAQNLKAYKSAILAPIIYTRYIVSNLEVTKDHE